MMNDDPASVATADIDVPPSIAELAAERRLGELRAARTDMAPGKLVIKAAGIAAVTLAVGAVGVATELRPLALVGFFGVVLALVYLVMAAKTALTGRRLCYVYTNGFVSLSNRRPRVITWPEVASMAAEPAGKPTPGCYRVKLTDGKKVLVPVGTLRPEWEAFGDTFELVARQAGVNITA